MDPSRSSSRTKRRLAADLEMSLRADDSGIEITLRSVRIDGADLKGALIRSRFPFSNPSEADSGRCVEWATQAASCWSRFARRKPTGVAERFLRTIRLECLDWHLVLNRDHLEHVLCVFADHYNGHRPHRALQLTPPKPRSEGVPAGSGARVQRRDRFGGVT
jgi:Integrase core domain